MEFNADGSLKLGGSIGKQVEEHNLKMNTTRCVKITKDATKTFAPKMCTLTLNASPMIEEGFVERTFDFFKNRVDSTVKLSQLSHKDFEVTIGNEFSRCKDCQSLVSSFRDYLEGNVIEKKGTCTFKGGDFWF